MEIITVEDLMVPIEAYGVVDEDATLMDAVIELQHAQERRDMEKHPHMHRAVLVQDKDKNIIGKISHIDILRGLEPRYQQMGDVRTMSRAGFSPDFLKSMMQTYALCDMSLTDMCARGTRVMVRDFIYTPAEGEYVEAEAALCEAIHQFVMGHHIGLLVVRDKKIIGVLRLSDVFRQVFEIMQKCKIEG